MASEGTAEDLTGEKWKEEEYRQNHLDHVIEVIQRWTRIHTARELFELGQLMHFPWAPIYSIKEVLRSPQLNSRGFFIEVDHPEISTSIKYPVTPFKLTDCSLDRWKRAPLIGEDNIQIYQRELGLSDEELKRLYSIHVI
jgi:crotonobetainyl-CoA:carnitine CoA-transferase CaiB-like acyl-CoA transferase